MKQKLKVKLLIILSISSLLFLNCEKDDQIASSSNHINNSKEKIKTIYKEEILKNQNISSMLDKVNKSIEKNKINRTIYSPEFDFYINTDYATYIESENGNYHSYTFPLFRDVYTSNIENLIFSLNPDGSYKTVLITYNLTPEEKEKIINGVSVNLEDKISSIEIDGTSLESNIFGKEFYAGGIGDCLGYVVTETSYCGCNEPSHATNLTGCQCIETTYDREYFGCGGSGGGGTTTGTGTTGSGTGTSGGSTYSGGSGGTGSNPVVSSPTPIDYTKIRVRCFSQNNPETSNWLNQPENADIKAEVIQYLENSVNQDGLQSTESCYPQEEVDIINQMINNYVNDIPIVIGPEVPITNIIEYLECFDLNQGATITIFADQPTPNSPTPVNSSIDVGHSFITIKQGMEQMTLGFYPMNHWGTGFLSDTVGQMGNNAGHSFDVSITLNVSAVTLQNIIINAVESATEHYNLNTNNCTDFAIETCNIMGLNVPDCYSNWGLGGGSNPGKFGQHLRTMSLPSGATRNTSGGTAPANHKGC